MAERSIRSDAAAPGMLQFCGWLLLEMALFAVLPAVFLIGYVHQYRAPSSAIWPHAQVVAILWGGLAFVRLICVVWLGRSPAQLLGSLFAAVVLFSMVMYYSLVWIGLGSWGRVISAELIDTYFSQLPALCAVLEVPFPAAVAALVCALLIGWWAAFRYLRAYDWVRALSSSVPRRTAGLLTFAVGAILLAGAWAFVQVPPAFAQEPVSLTFFPDAGQTRLQSHAVSRFQKLDEDEDRIRSAYVPNSAAMKRNVFVIVVDALRADHLGFNGYQRPTSPHLDALAHAAGAGNVRRMYSACAESACGLMALSSSRLPHQFSRRPMTLPQVLAKHGYYTYMILGGDHTHFYGLREAYGDIDEYYDGSMASGWYMNDDRLVTARLAELPDWQGNPVFMQLHLMSAHGLGRRQEEFNRYQPVQNMYTGFGKSVGRKDPETIRSYVNFYDNGVLQTDQMIHDVLTTLDRKGYLRNSVVVITADHGELLGEHGNYTHAKTIYEPVLDIPFLMLRYGYASEDQVPRETIASQVDIAPTILHELDIPAPASWIGLALQSGSEILQNRQFIFFQQQSEYGLVDLRRNGAVWKYRVDAHTHAESAYDLSRSRSEETNQLGEVPGEVRTEWVKQLLGMQAAATGSGSDSGGGATRQAH